MKHLPLLSEAERPSFDAALARNGLPPLVRGPVSTLQINVGKRCNQACLHCHVDAGPQRTEMMSDAVLERVLLLASRDRSLQVIDITGGAPELHPRFRDLVQRARGLAPRVIDRCNLTILSEPGQEDLAAFLAEQGVEVVASLPCYGEANVDGQRGRGVFSRSLAGLRQLNALGYGRPLSGLSLDLVYNPGGAFLPPAQADLEARFRRELAEYGIVFSRLLTITNVPIHRFAHGLRRDGQLAAYMGLLHGSFNASTVPGLMCLSQISVGYDGGMYDCDFNQMLEIPSSATAGRTVFEVEHLHELTGEPVQTATHCLACTAGAGSSCGGALQG